jgi:DNA-binding beta-propeller fold protein YncE
MTLHSAPSLPARIVLGVCLGLALACGGGSSSAGAGATTETLLSGQPDGLGALANNPWLGRPQQMALDDSGNLYAVDSMFDLVQVQPAGKITWQDFTAHTRVTPAFLAVDADNDGNEQFYVGERDVTASTEPPYPETERHVIEKLDLTNHSLVTAAQWYTTSADPGPGMDGIILDHGSIYVLDSQSRCIWVLAPDAAGDLTNFIPFITFPDPTFFPHAMAFLDPQHSLLVVGGALISPGSQDAQLYIMQFQQSTPPVWSSDPSFFAISQDTIIQDISALAIDSAQNLYFACGTNTVWEASYPFLLGAKPKFLAGAWNQDGSAEGAGSDARFGPYLCLAPGATPGTIYISDYMHKEILQSDGDPATVSFRTGCPTASQILNGTDSTATFCAPGMLATSNGKVLVADVGDELVRQVDPTADQVSTLAGTPAVAGSQNGPAASATFGTLLGIAAADSRVYVMDEGVLRLIADGTVTTLAGQRQQWDLAQAGLALDGVGTSALFGYPRGIALDNGQNRILVADGETIRAVDLTGLKVTTPYDLPGTQLLAVAVGPDGSMFAADAAGESILKLDATGGGATIIAGPQTTAPDGAAWVTLTQPCALAVDAAGVVFVADSAGNQVLALTQDPTLAWLASPVAGADAIPAPQGLTVAQDQLMVSSGNGLIAISDPAVGLAIPQL